MRERGRNILSTVLVSSERDSLAIGVSACFHFFHMICFRASKNSDERHIGASGNAYLAKDDGSQVRGMACLTCSCKTRGNFVS